MSRSILIVAGEVSGDMHAARVVAELKKREPDIYIWGVGGDELQEQGVDILFHVRDMAVVGLWEVLKRYRFFRRVFNTLVYEMSRRSPDAVLLVDYPGFNLRFAKAAHAQNVNVFYYICPQVWAWNKRRIPEMAKVVDRLMVIFPFEVDIFHGYSVQTDFVGHPLVEKTRLAREDDTLCMLPGNPLVALLPGSRNNEIERILPVMWQAAQRVRKMKPKVGFAIAATSSEGEERIRTVLTKNKLELTDTDTIVVGKTRQLLKHARAAMVASGTATIETALMRCPMIIVYKTSWLTYVVGRMVIRVPYLGMVNIVSDKQLCPEYLQHDAQPKKMADAMLDLMEDGMIREQMLAGFDAMTEKLGGGRGPVQIAEILTNGASDE